MNEPTSPPEIRNIVIFCDGTWNSPEEEAFGVPTATNVYKLYRASLDQAESAGRQITWYQQGVGATGSVYRRAFEGATGTGISPNIKRGYSAIASHYRGPNDRIFLVGFSRGAFTARSIAGMIQRVGLVRNPTREAVRRAYDAYYAASDGDDSTAAVVHRAREDVRSDVRIHAIGVWETVGALGLCFWGTSFNFRPFFRNGFHSLSPARITDNVVQALGIDEKRTSFVPTRWLESAQEASKPGRRPSVTEVWFRGVHSDIGGGYGDCGLSDITLQWMASQMKALGLELRPGAPVVKPDHNARVHNSFRGPLWVLVKSWPRWPPMHTLRELALASGPYLHESVASREQDLVSSGIDERKRVWLKEGDQHRIEIRAQHLWEYTGIVLEPAARYRLTCSGGRWQDCLDTPVGGEGQDPKQESLFKRLSRWLRRKRDAPYMSMIALPNVDPNIDQRERGLLAAIYFMFVGSRAFARHLAVVDPIRGSLIRTEQSAMLWCFANDQWKRYENNTGGIVLTVTREP